jgi:DNA-binding transcriptional ArsR family regulator
MGDLTSSAVGSETLAAPDLTTIDGMTVLQALSDPVRLEIVRQLAGCSGSSELKCGQIELPVTKSTASHHFKTLFAAGIVAEREQGTSKFMRLRRAELDQRFPGLLDSVLRASAVTI